MAFTLLIKQVQHFEDREDLEHYVKAHMEITYDHKTELLKNDALLVKNPEDENEYIAINIVDHDARASDSNTTQGEEQ